MSDLRIGKLCGPNAKRDALHVAVLPAVADQYLDPGDSVSISSLGKARITSRDEAVGIVDPFLKASVYPGERFLVLMNPGSVSNLRHDWDHPSVVTTPVVVPVLAPEDDYETDDGCKGCW